MQRFWDKVIKKDSGCWEWIASTRNGGYGAFKINGKVIDSHRFSFTLTKGDIPQGLFVCHTCDNRKCVNPDHLFLGTPKENFYDAVNKNRIDIEKLAGNGFKKDSPSPSRKLTKHQVTEIRVKFDNRQIAKRQLAREYGVDEKAIRDLLSDKTYREVQ